MNTTDLGAETRRALRRHYERERIAFTTVSGDVEELDEATGRWRVVLSAGGIRVTDHRRYTSGRH